MSGDAVIEPLFTIFKNCLKCGIFPIDWKKEILYLYFKKTTNKSSKTIVSLSFLICSKVFEHSIYDNMLKYFLSNNLIYPKQSGFRHGDSCVNKFLSISHDIFYF